MTHLSTILVDDEKRGRTVVKELLNRYCPQVNVIAECSNTHEAKIAIADLNPQLVFLDVSMPLQNAFEMLSELSSITFEIIFVTAHSQYSIQAFKYSAIDYLLKPVSEDLLIDAVTKAQQRIEEKQFNNRLDTLLHNIKNEYSTYEKKICIAGIKGFQVIELKNILYLEAESCYTIFYLNDGTKLTSSKTISEYEDIIDEISFIRVHKSYVVNINYMKEYIKGEGGYIVLLNGKEIEVSRRKKDFFLKIVNKMFIR